MDAAVTNEEALRLARTQLQIRYQQLSACRTCGVDAKRFEEAIERIRQLELQHRGDSHDIQVQQSQS